MFRKSKIQTGIDNTAIKYNSEDFDSLDILKKKLNNKKVANRLFVNPSKAMVQDIGNKYTKTSKYLINHWQFILKWSVYLLVLATLVILNILLFMPFYGVNVGANWTIINNTWIASLVNDNIVYLMTPLGFSFVAIAIFTIVVFVAYFVYSRKRKKDILEKNNQIIEIDRTNKIILIFSYVLFGLSILLILITILIPPTASSLYSEQMLSNSYAYIQRYQTNQVIRDDAKLISSIKTIYDYYGYQMPTSYVDVNDLLKKFSDNYSEGLFSSTIYYKDYWFFADVFKESISTLSIAGIIVTVFYSVMLSTGAIILPTIVTYRNVKVYYHENKEYNKSWNIWTLFIYLIMRCFGKNYIKAFSNFRINQKAKRAKKKEEHKNKETYSKFRKQNKEDGLSNSESFNSNQVNNAAFTLITKEEIESHEANKAFLNADGEWMYHDGDGNYFIAKNDDWIKYDLKKAIHKVHVDANAKLNLDPSRKQYKEGRFKKAKNKKSTQIALPDDDLDEILKKLDI